MSWKPDSDVEVNPALDGYRDSIAELTGDDAFGYVAFRVQPYWSFWDGFLWWRKWRPGREFVEYLETLWFGRSDAGALDDATHDDGVAAEGSPYLDQVRSGRVTATGRLHGRTRHVVLTVRWLEGDERAAAWEEWGYGGS